MLWALASPCPAPRAARRAHSAALLQRGAAMPADFRITASHDQARAGVLRSPRGKELQTPTLLISTSHGFFFHSDASALADWQQQHGQLGIAVSGAHM
jgi:hypothetical protein